MAYIAQEFAEKRGRALTALVEQDILDSADRLAKIRESRALYNGTATADMPLPWDGASNIHLPIIQEKTEGLVPILQMAFWGVDPVVNAQRLPAEFDAEQTRDVEQYLNYVFTKDVPNSYENFEHWMRNMTNDGVSPLKVFWEYQERAVSEIHTLKSAYDIGEMTPLGVPIEAARFKVGLELLIELFGPESSVTGLVDAQMVVGEDEMVPMGSTWEAIFTQDRKVFNAAVYFFPSDKVDEIKARVRRKAVIRDCACYETLEFDDLIMPFRAADVQTADRVTQRYWLTVDEIEARRDSGEWNITDEEMEILRGSAVIGSLDSTYTDSQLKRQKDALVGDSHGTGTESVVTLPDGYAAYNKNKVMIFMVFLSDDPEGDHEQYEVIYHIPYALRKIVRMDYLDEEFPHGKRPFILAKYLPISGSWFALGIGDQLAAINMECNTIINQVNNNQELINNPFYFYEPHAFVGDSAGIQRLAPGQGVPVQSVQGIMFPQFPQQPLSNLQMMTSLLMFADRVTVSPLQMGSTQMKNAPSTARGTLAVLGEGHVKTDMLITRLQRSAWMELVEQVHGLHMELGSDEKWYYVTRKDGSRKPKRISRHELRMRCEYNFRGNVMNTNREVLKNMAQVRYATLLSNPLYASSPQQMRNLVEDFLRYWGEGTDIDRLLPALPGTEGFEHPPLTQDEENQSMRMGLMVSVLPTDDHAAHLAKMDQFEKSDGFAMMQAHAVGVYAAHKRAHQLALQQQMAMAQTPQAPGTANNVPQGVALGQQGNDSGVLEGGNMR